MCRPAESEMVQGVRHLMSEAAVELHRCTGGRSCQLKIARGGELAAVVSAGGFAVTGATGAGFAEVVSGGGGGIVSGVGQLRGRRLYRCGCGRGIHGRARGLGIETLVCEVTTTCHG